MREIPSSLQAALDTGATTLARCWRVARPDGVVLGFTDHDLPLDFDGVVHEHEEESAEHREEDGAVGHEIRQHRVLGIDEHADAPDHESGEGDRACAVHSVSSNFLRSASGMRASGTLRECCSTRTQAIAAQRSRGFKRPASGPIVPLPSVITRYIAPSVIVRNASAW